MPHTVFRSSAARPSSTAPHGASAHTIARPICRTNLPYRYRIVLARVRDITRRGTIYDSSSRVPPSRYHPREVQGNAHALAEGLTRHRGGCLVCGPLLPAAALSLPRGRRGCD